MSKWWKNCTFHKRTMMWICHWNCSFQLENKCLHECVAQLPFQFEHNGSVIVPVGLGFMTQVGKRVQAVHPEKHGFPLQVCAHRGFKGKTALLGIHREQLQKNTRKDDLPAFPWKLIHYVFLKTEKGTSNLNAPEAGFLLSGPPGISDSPLSGPKRNSQFHLNPPRTLRCCHRLWPCSRRVCPFLPWKFKMWENPQESSVPKRTEQNITLWFEQMSSFDLHLQLEKN